jgi:HD-like signal output (HDOD) protein
MNDGGTLANPQVAHAVNLRQAIQNLDALPAMPVIAQKLLALRMDTDEGEKKMLVLIEQDPQISAKVIGLANSAAVASTRHITSLRDAVMLLGISRIKSVATGIAIMSLMTKAPAGRFNMQDLWLHSFGIAFAMLGIARAMPENIRPQDDQVFLAGLLHDIGYLALAFLDPKRSDTLHARLAAEPGRMSLEIEREMLEMCHDEMGSELVRHWNLPEEIISVLRYHHTPNAAGAAAGQPLVYMINIAEKLLPSFGINEFVDGGIRAEDWETLGIDPDSAEEIKEQVEEQADQAMQFASTFA